MAAGREERLREMIQRKPEDPFARYALAMEYKQSDRFDEAKRCFEELLAISPNYVPAYFQFGQLLLDGEDHESAKAVLESGMTVAKDAGDQRASAELEALLQELADSA